MRKIIISRPVITILAFLAALGLIALFGRATPSPFGQSSPASHEIELEDWGHPVPTGYTYAPWPYIYPEDIQGYVSRVDVIAIATVSEISAPVEEGPYRLPGTPHPPEEAGFPDLTITVTYYTLNLEQILLDDGNISDNPNLRQSGIHSKESPQVGQRYLFGMRINPDEKSYGAPKEWNIIPLDGGSLRNIDGTPTEYVGVTDEASLKEAIESAIPGRARLQPDQWPRVSVNEDAPAETPQAPGGPDDGDGGPTGNTNN